MADTQRTRAEILALFADNVTGQISAQDSRDFIVTVMETDFQFAGDFYTEPKPAFTTTDKTGRGWIDYSQVAGSTLSFGDALHYLGVSGVWRPAHANTSARNPCTGIALDSYASNATNVQVLRRGLLYDSSLSATWSGQCGKPIYLASASVGEYSYTPNTTSVCGLVTNVYSNPGPVIGMYEGASTGAAAGSGHFRFNPMWFVTGA
jgi:hypothetical protein